MYYWVSHDSMHVKIFFKDLYFKKDSFWSKIRQKDPFFGRFSRIIGERFMKMNLFPQSFEVFLKNKLKRIFFQKKDLFQGDLWRIVRKRPIFRESFVFDFWIFIFQNERFNFRKSFEQKWIFCVDFRSFWWIFPEDPDLFCGSSRRFLKFESLRFNNNFSKKIHFSLTDLRSSGPIFDLLCDFWIFRVNLSAKFGSFGWILAKIFGKRILAF